MTLLKNLAKLVIPPRGREALRALQRRILFWRAMRRLKRLLSQDADPPAGVLADLVQGWGNPDWSLHSGHLLTLLRHARQAGGPILDCGSGLSTLLLGLVADNRGNRVWSLEHIPAWAEKVQAILRRYRIHSVQLCTAELRNYGAYSWYDPPKARMPTDFSLVVCDGPPGDTPGGRYGLLPVMRSHLKPGCIILLDDAQRPAEQAVVQRWADELGTRPKTLAIDEAADQYVALLTVPDIRPAVT